MGRPELYPVKKVIGFDEKMLEAVEKWRGKQKPIPSVSETIRTLVEIGLSHHRPLAPTGKPHKGASRAEEMAKEGMQAHLTGVSGEERATRKARLLKVPGQKSKS
jgi:hypothetical protein